ncbi:MAG TPA: aminotransferase class I/II-fold pyridoxal phosphate-dependent enzyme [Polyangiaceae bacterium]|nr:aminotransferase class I/II-fold pyridoxal phosphate-dependent enzyme [Polyangiaceae bacterium]
MAARKSLDVHINLNVRGMSPSATVAINERCNELLEKGLDIYKLGLGQSPFPVPEPVVQALRDNAHQKDYLPVKGLRSLRHEVAAYHSRVQGIEGDADDVLIGPGSKELMFLLQLVYYGDIVIPTPAWVSYAPQADIVGRKVRWLHTLAADEWRFLPSQLEDLCRQDPNRPRVLILNYPSNPTGLTFTKRELEQLATVARRYRVVVLSDEIYGELMHDGSHDSIGTLYPEGTIVSSGLSKWCGAGGWRLGTFMFPKALRWLLDAMAAVASETYTSTSAPIQYAAVSAFRGGPEIDRYLKRSRLILSGLGRWCAGKLREAGAKSPDPHGAFYLFPDLSPLRDRLARRGIVDSEQLCMRLLEETGVAILPGSSFGRPAQELNVRLAYVDFDGGDVLAALDRAEEEGPVDEGFLRAHCPHVTEAIERMAEWLRQD